MAEIEVAKVTDLASGQGKVVEANGKEIGLFNINGTFHAIDNTCPHMGGPLGEGECSDSVVACPWHGWQFDVKTGVSPVNPAAKITTYPVRVDGGKVFVHLE